jgi:hypothetical protein
MGRPQIYNEPTSVLSIKVPNSHIPRLKKVLQDELTKLRKPINNLKKIKGR